MAEGGLGGKAVQVRELLILIVILLLLLYHSIPHALKRAASAGWGDNDISAAGSCDTGCRGEWI